MKTKCNSTIRAACQSFCGALMLMASGAQAQNLFVSDVGSNSIIEITTGGAHSIFASGLDQPTGLAFNSAGDLFEADFGSGNIYEFTPNGTRSTFAFGLYEPEGLAFNSAGDLFVTDQGSHFANTGNIYEFTPSGTQSTFASGLNPGGAGLAFSSAGDLFEAGGSGNIYEFTPNGTRSTFASGLGKLTGLAFQPVPEPSTLGLLAVGVAALLVRRRARKRSVPGIF